MSYPPWHTAHIYYGKYQISDEGRVWKTGADEENMFKAQCPMSKAQRTGTE